MVKRFARLRRRTCRPKQATFIELMPDLAALCDEDLTKLIDDLAAEEEEISYRRRLLQGKIDILRAELEGRRQKTGRRSVLESLDIPALTAILTKKPTLPCSSGGVDVSIPKPLDGLP